MTIHVPRWFLVALLGLVSAFLVYGLMMILVFGLLVGGHGSGTG